MTPLGDTPPRGDLLVEVGCEELPPAAVALARERLPAAAAEAFAGARLPAEEVTAFATPRRLVLIARGMPPLQEPEVKKVTGPPKAQAVDAKGAFTAAARAFLKKWNADAKSARFEKSERGEYLVVEVAAPRRPAADVLAEILPPLFGRLPFPKTMRWPQSADAFPRPVRWLVGIYAGEVVPFSFAGLVAGATSRGHRVLGEDAALTPLFRDGRVSVAAVKDFYGRKLAVLLDVADRRARVVAGLPAIGAPPDYFDGADYHVQWTLGVVLDSVEMPGVVAGRFDEKFLALPAEVVEAALLSYLHLFPIKDAAKKLTASFFAVHNARPEAASNVVAGLTRVLKARLADAAYFWEEDKKTPLAEMAAGLTDVIFAEGAGTLAEKAARLQALAGALARRLALTPDAERRLVRAAALCKADLVSQLVREKEFTHLQGTAGYLFAQAQGEDEEVARAIGEHYRPVAADDPLPETPLGRILSAADRSDTLVVLFAAGYKPTGARDPYGLRRAAIGLCRLLVEDEDGFFRDLTVEEMVETVGEVAAVAPAVAEEVKDFVRGRLVQIFKGQGFRDDMVEAVVSPAAEGLAPARPPRDQLRRLAALATFYKDRQSYSKLAIAFRRPLNILRQARERGLSWTTYDERLAEDEEERRLHYEYAAAVLKVLPALESRDYDAALRHLAELRPAVDAFFDKVMVMDEDPRRRANRLALMQLLADLFLRFVDFSRLRGEEEYV